MQTSRLITSSLHPGSLHTKSKPLFKDHHYQCLLATAPICKSPNQGLTAKGVEQFKHDERRRIASLLLSCSLGRITLASCSSFSSQSSHWVLFSLHLAVLCDSLKCRAYGTFCYGISRNVINNIITSHASCSQASASHHSGTGLTTLGLLM